ncbi:MAG: hypothetical protein KDA37_16755 [Planctomycetales bacterium]|nr:hypothetical protein [Planctomycetales bacterium]
MAPSEYDASAEFFTPQESAAPMVEAVRQMAADRGEAFETFVGKSYGELGAIAEETYDELPEFWRVWKDWHTPQPRPHMGDLKTTPLAPAGIVSPPSGDSTIDFGVFQLKWLVPSVASC